MESLILADVTNIQKQRTPHYKKTTWRNFYKISHYGVGPVYCTATTYWGKRVITCDFTEGIFGVPLNKTGAVILHVTIVVTITRSEYSVTSNPLLNRFISIAILLTWPTGLPVGLPSGQLSSLICRREDTVSTLWNQLSQHKIMHARGTLSRGNTTLGIVLQAHVERERPDMTVYRITWPSPFPEKYSLLPYYRLLNDMLEIKNEHIWEYMRNTLLIVDEVQSSYTYNTFWNDLIKNMPNSLDNNLFILLLSSYGSPSAVAVPPQLGTSPVVLSPQCRISIRPLLHTNPLVGLNFTRKVGWRKISKCRGLNSAR